MNKVLNVLVTGGNRGIGLGIVNAFAQQGHQVFMASRDKSAAQQACRELGTLADKVAILEMDVADRLSIDRALQQLEQQAIAVDVLVNNAGVLPDGDLLSLTDEELDTSFAINVTGPLHLVRRLAPGMYDRGFGRVVNISSDWGSFASGMGGPGSYGVTKAALNALTVRLAKDLPSCIKVNAMNPGWVKTRMGGEGAPRTPEEAAETAYWLGTLPEAGPSGGFFYDKTPIEW